MANHRSIRDEQELVLLPVYDKGKAAVPVAAVFGANASGKSTLLDGLHWMRRAVLESFAVWQPGSGVPRTPFRLDAVTDRPSTYAFEVMLGDVRYAYGFEVDDHRVSQEWLYVYPRNRRRVIFERHGSKIRFGSTVPDARHREEVLAGLTRPNALLLSVAAHSNQPEVQHLYRWLREEVRIADQGRTVVIADLVSRMIAEPARRQSTLALIRAADLGIRDVQVVYGTDEETLHLLEEDLVSARRHRDEAHRMLVKLRQQVAEMAEPPQAASEMLQFVEEQVIPSAVHDEQRALMELRRAQAAREEPPMLLFVHSGGPGPLEFEDESAGTRTWLALLTATLDVLERGGLLVVDELDLSLHPHLAARLVNLFRDPDTNPRLAQLVFTTHDATLLDEETLSRDEIWFVEKDPDTGASRLFPLTDFHPRKNENTEGRYLAGSYGAVPLIAEANFRDAMHGWRTADDAA